MSEGCTPELMMEHEKRLTKVEESTKSAHHRMDNLQAFTDTMHEMNANVMVIAEQVKTMAQTLLRHEDDIQSIKQSMETKETVARLHGKVEELEEVMDRDRENEKNRQIKELEDIINPIKKAAITAGVFIGAGLMFLGVAVIWYMMQSGQVPTP